LNWYEEFIEPEIRDIVKILRDNGINTESSCGHKMWIQFQVLDNEVMKVDKLLCNLGYRNYLIEYNLERSDGYLNSTATIYFEMQNKKYPIQSERTSALEAFCMRKTE
jgi:hypothetical protein